MGQIVRFPTERCVLSPRQFMTELDRLTIENLNLARQLEAESEALKAFAEELARARTH